VSPSRPPCGRLSRGLTIAAGCVTQEDGLGRQLPSRAHAARYRSWPPGSFAECTQVCPAGRARRPRPMIALLPPNCAHGSRWTASGITWLAPTSANRADATVTVHRVRTVSSTGSTGPSKLTPSRTLVRPAGPVPGPLRPPRPSAAVRLLPARRPAAGGHSGRLLGERADQEREPPGRHGHQRDRPLPARRPVHQHLNQPVQHFRRRRRVPLPEHAQKRALRI
jgi:hypothetical protein